MFGRRHHSNVSGCVCLRGRVRWLLGGVRERKGFRLSSTQTKGRENHRQAATLTRKQTTDRQTDGQTVGRSGGRLIRRRMGDGSGRR